MFDVHIPELTDEELLKKYETIKPVVRDEEGKLYWIKGEATIAHLRKTAYTWEPEYIREVRDDELHGIVSYDFACLHTYGYYGFFKPSIAEVLSQINYDYVGREVCLGGTNHILHLVAFEIIESPQKSDDMYKSKLLSLISDLGYQVSTVRLLYSNVGFKGYPEGV